MVKQDHVLWARKHPRDQMASRGSVLRVFQDPPHLGIQRTCENVQLGEGDRHRTSADFWLPDGPQGLRSAGRSPASTCQASVTAILTPWHFRRTPASLTAQQGQNAGNHKAALSCFQKNDTLSWPKHT